jgi:hypothetical protein
MNIYLIANISLAMIALGLAIWLFIRYRKSAKTASSKVKAKYTVGAFIQEMLSESSGNPSSIRFGVIFMAVAFVLVIAWGFVYTVLYYKELVITYLLIIITAVEGAFGIKVWQKGKEAPAEDEVKS